MADSFSGQAAGLASPASNVVAITPDDNTDLANVTRGIYVGVGGDIVLNPAGGGSSVTFKNAATGSVLPVRAARVLATNTTAGNLLALY